VQGGTYVEPVEDEIFGHVFDNRLLSVAVLRGFWRAHKAELAKIPFARTEALGKYSSFVERFSESWGREMSVPGKEKFSFVEVRARIEGEDCDAAEDAKDTDVLAGWNFKGHTISTLEELVQFGVAFRDLSGLVLMDLVKELEELESHRVLVVVDQYNSWSAKSAYEYEHTPVLGGQIVVPKVLSYLSRKKADGEMRTMKNGLFVCAESLKHPEGSKELYKAAANSVPLTIQVPHYSQVEFLSAVSFYTAQMCVHEGISVQDLLAYRTLVNSNPRLARLDSGSFFIKLGMAAVQGDYMLLDQDLDEDDDSDGYGDDDGDGDDRGGGRGYDA
jgi:hypothetical protein